MNERRGLCGVAGRVLLREVKVCKRALGQLFRQRWNVELDLRAMKTTLQMNEKELWVHFLAYNLIRLLMAQAAAKAAVHPRHLSFKHTVQLWSAAIDLLFKLIG